MVGGVSGDFRQTRAAPINLHSFRKKRRNAPIKCRGDISTSKSVQTCSNSTSTSIVQAETYTASFHQLTCILSSQKDVSFTFKRQIQGNTKTRLDAILNVPVKNQTTRVLVRNSVKFNYRIHLNFCVTPWEVACKVPLSFHDNQSAASEIS